MRERNERIGKIVRERRREAEIKEKRKSDNRRRAKRRERGIITIGRNQREEVKIETTLLINSLFVT